MKNLTKKLSLLIALCMIVTVGGVYAQWVYSDSQASANTATRALTPGMQIAINESSSSGYFETHMRTLSITIADDKDNGTDVGAGVAGDYKPEIIYDGLLVFMYQPRDNATEATMEFPHQITETSDIKFTDHQGVESNVFEIKNSTDMITGTLLTEETVTKFNSDYAAYNLGLTIQDYGKYIIIADLSQHLSIADTIVLDELTEYYEFQELIATTSIVFDITDGASITTN